MIITQLHTFKYRTDFPATKREVLNRKVAFEGRGNVTSKISDTIAIQSNIELLKYFLKITSDTLKFNESMIDFYKSSIASCSETLKDLAFEKFPEHIDFVEAKTLSEAKEFAKSVLKIDDYDVYDLSIANIVNEGMVMANNFTKGKCPMPKSVSLKHLVNEQAQDILDYFNNRAIAQVQDGHLTMNHFLFNEKENDKSELLRAVCHEMGHILDINHLVTQNSSKTIAQSQKKCEALEKKVAAQKKEIEKVEKQLEYLINPPKKTFKEKLFAYLHRLLNKKTKTEPNKIIYNMDVNLIEKDTTLPDVNIVKLRLQEWGIKEKRIAETLTDYATTSAKEFIAEAFSMFCTRGVKHCTEEVLGLYKRFEGPCLSEFEG